MSFSLHSSTENLGGGRRSSSNGSNSSSSCRDSEKSLIGLMSRNVLASPSLRNHSKLDRWISDQVRQFKRLDEVGKRVSLSGRGGSSHESLP